MCTVFLYAIKLNPKVLLLRTILCSRNNTNKTITDMRLPPFTPYYTTYLYHFIFFPIRASSTSVIISIFKNRDPFIHAYSHVFNYSTLNGTLMLFIV